MHTHRHKPHRQAAPDAARFVRPQADRHEEGVALILALIFSILLYILVAELVVSSRMVRQTGENDALLARMRTQMTYQLGEAEDKLLADMAGDEGEGGDLGGGGEGLAGALGEAGAGAGGLGGGGEGGEGEEETDPSANCDSSRDAWFEPVGHPDNDLTTYVWIEDENRKFNILSVWSPDQDYAQESREGLSRLIDALREDTEFDVSSADASVIVQRIVDWGRRSSTLEMPTPELKSLSDLDRELVLPLHLDELLMIDGIDEDLFFDRVFDERVHLGLESVLTIWTSLRADPGDPEKMARQRAVAEARGESVAEPGADPAGGEEGGGGAPGETGAPNGEEGPPRQEGLGVKVNINTASLPVLRGLFDPGRVSDRVLDAIIRYRSELDEEASQDAQDETDSEVADFGGDMQLGDQQLRQFFETVADLSEVDEYEQLEDEIKEEMQRKLTTNSEVFSIHMASLFKRSDDERRRAYMLLRSRSIVLRIDDGEEGKILPLVPFEERVGMRVQPIDGQDDYFYDPSERYTEMDQFSADERAWNPFLLDFYLPQETRERFFR
ncbi:MAG: hypothetical protein AB8H80_18070 [Planctomycetota bacterium]